MNMENEKQTAIELKHVTKRYKLFKDDKQRLHAVFNKRIQPKIKLAINDMSFEVKKGESVALFGRNGAGKSTTMNILTGYISSTSGSAKIDGIDILDDPIAAKKRIGFLPEQPPLLT